ncbi:hypothetical protein [Curtobacterium sp. MCSS17_016]|uniref:hypothetical protein n=1 Tax=Curtobacterium sp. MCSS17_016 TaxID=2175644 RepID=UPI000DA97E95|nr:hypothetical protein [Curtobacterium sp. MCSS17_016]WIE81353.1 hypothetical protein DEJ19_019150 [Curtobacterium sp. MCSS17_016]
MTRDITTPTVTIRELRRAQSEVDNITWRIRSNRADYLDARLTVQRSWLRRTRSSLVVLAAVGTALAIGLHLVHVHGWTDDTAGAVILPSLVGAGALIAFGTQLSARADARIDAAYAYKRLRELRGELPAATARRDWAARWHELVSNTTPEQMAAGGIVVLDKNVVR